MEPEAVISVGNGSFAIDIEIAQDAAPEIRRYGPVGGGSSVPPGQPLVEIVTRDSGNDPSTTRLTRGELSARLRYVDHAVRTDPSGDVQLRLRLRETVGGPAAWTGQITEPGLEVTAILTVPATGAVLRSRVRVTNPASAASPRVVRSVASIALHVALGPEGTSSPDDLTFAAARNDWIGESRWTVAPLRACGLADVGLAPRGVGSRGHITYASRGTWSTGTFLAAGALWATETGEAVVWQIEHNGPWRFDVAEDPGGTSLALAGPTDDDHQWIAELRPGESFDSVPVSIAFGSDLDAAVAEMTRWRRRDRRPHADNAALGVVYNDYMNTLMGEPTTGRLLPLVETAAAAGADYFVIDAGWYEDRDDWWTTVGAWRPSRERFPNGLEEVVDRIRALGMQPGLWLEPEVVGAASPVAASLPPEAFFRVRGVPVIESSRLHLDLRHPAARAHLDEVVDRLVDEFGVRYFKFDYNVTVRPGTDTDASSPGSGLLEANRAHIAWLTDVLDRHPGLVVENCGSGAMRADWAMLRVAQLQSTSDQQEWSLYPPIAAAAPFTTLPEQAANWAYPAAGMTLEETASTLALGIGGRFMLSGFLDRLDEAQRRLTAEAIRVHRSVQPLIRNGVPEWPLGIDQRDAPWVVSVLAAEQGRLVSVWRRDGAPPSLQVPFRALAGAAVDVETLFPAEHSAWECGWDADAGVLTIRADESTAAARVMVLRRRES